MRRTVLLVGITAVVLMPIAAIAHNAGHIFLPDGVCLEVGSFKEAPIVGPDGEPLDLIEATSRDEFGVSYVGVAKDTPIFPGACPIQAEAAGQSTGK